MKKVEQLEKTVIEQEKKNEELKKYIDLLMEEIKKIKEKEKKEEKKKTKTKKTKKIGKSKKKNSLQ